MVVVVALAVLDVLEAGCVVAEGVAGRGVAGVVLHLLVDEDGGERLFRPHCPVDRGLLDQLLVVHLVYHLLDHLAIDIDWASHHLLLLLI